MAVFVDANTNGVLDAGEQSTSLDTQTGTYTLDGLTEGSHEIVFEDSSGGNLIALDPQGGSQTVDVVDYQTAATVDFNSVSLADYDTQHGGGVTSILDSGATLELDGNTWQALALGAAHTITQDTVLEVTFSSTSEGEIQGIGVADDLSRSGEQLFQFFGTETPGASTWNQDFNDYDTSDGEKTYSIRLGDYLTIGDTVSYLVFVNDEDAAPIDAQAQFKNVRLYEDLSATADFTYGLQFELTGNAEGDLGTQYTLNIDTAALGDKKVIVDWGDGTTSVGIKPDTGNDWGNGITGSIGSLTATHTYAQAGYYPITATLEDDYGTRVSQPQAALDVAFDGDGKVTTDAWAGAPARGSVLEFDGAVDYVEAGFVLDPSTTAFSASAWFKLDQIPVSGSATILSQKDGGGTGRGWLQVYEDGSLRSYLGGDALISTGIVQANTWHHASVVNDGTTVKLYLDGQEVASSSETIESALGGMVIGAHKSTTQHFTDGLIDEVRIYDRAITPAEIQSLTTPAIAITGPSSINEDDPATYTSTVAAAVDGQAVTYEWLVQKDALDVDLTGVTTDTDTLTFTPADPGSYAITLTVTDEDGNTLSDTQSLSFDREEEQPVDRSRHAPIGRIGHQSQLGGLLKHYYRQAA